MAIATDLGKFRAIRPIEIVAFQFAVLNRPRLTQWETMISASLLCCGLPSDVTLQHIRRMVLVGISQAALLAALGCGQGKDTKPEVSIEQPAGPIAELSWVRPAYGLSIEPVWGLKGALNVGLWPTSGPRGLIRIYAPYLGQPFPRMVNFISVEPIVWGVRGQSELEIGLQSGQMGLTMMTSDTPPTAAPPEPLLPTPGRIEHEDGSEILTFCLATEPFRNGARPLIQILLRADRPHEVGFRVYAAAGSAPMEACVLSATMGNYSQLRRLWLRGEVVDARKLWPAFQPDRLGFAPWRMWGRDRLLTRDGTIFVAARSDEPEPGRAQYDPDVAPYWRYEGRAATQYWRTANADGAKVQVNGRSNYWGNGGRIPGGTSFENFELKLPFAEGQEFWFGVTPEEPAELGFDPAWQRNITNGN